MSQNVLITGASSGVGAATAKYLSERGITTILVARNKERLCQVADQLPSPCFVYPYDLTDLEHIEDIFIYCQEQGIKLNGMVHSAGVTGISPIRSLTIDILQSTMSVNFFSFVELARHYANHKYAERESSIVAISSISSYICAPATGSYSSSKAALNAMVKVLSKEFLKHKIRVNAIAPANVKTPLTEDLELYGELSHKQLDDVQPLGYIEMEQITSMIAYLLSDQAKYITGTIIPISAGMNY